MRALCAHTFKRQSPKVISRLSRVIFSSSPSSSFQRLPKAKVKIDVGRGHFRLFFFDSRRLAIKSRRRCGLGWMSILSLPQLSSGEGPQPLCTTYITGTAHPGAMADKKQYRNVRSGERELYRSLREIIFARVPKM